MDILITDVKRNKVITNDQTRIEALEKLKTIVEFNQNGKWGETLYNAKNIIIKTVKDNSINRNYIVLMAKLETIDAITPATITEINPTNNKTLLLIRRLSFIAEIG